MVGIPVATRMCTRTTVPAFQALGRLKAGTLNKTEALYAETLKLRQTAGEVMWWKFEPFNLRLADGCFYRPDFAVLLCDGALECHEVKGHWTDDARVKIKVAAAQFPFRFVALKVVAKKNGGGWFEEEF